MTRHFGTWRALSRASIRRPSRPRSPREDWAGPARLCWGASAGLRVGRQDQHAQRRQLQTQRPAVAVHRMGIGLDLTGIADAAAAILDGIGVDPFGVAAGA